jgi:hypothetical protein
MSAPRSDYIVFVDESGDHSLAAINPEWPLFVLSFRIFPVAAYVGHDTVILHEHDIRKKKGTFAQLNKEARDTFLDRLTEIIADKKTNSEGLQLAAHLT